MKRPYSFEDAQRDALKSIPKPKPVKVYMSAETIAKEAIKDALKALQRAIELSEQAGYGSLVLGPLSDAQREVRYAHETAMGRN